MDFEFQGSYYGICHFSMSSRRLRDGWVGGYDRWIDGWINGVRVMDVLTATSLYVVLGTHHVLY